MLGKLCQANMDESESTVLQILDNLENLPETATASLDVQNVPLTYRIYMLLVEGLIAKGENVQKNLPKILNYIDPDLKIPTKISNFTRKVRKHCMAGGSQTHII